LIEVGEKMVVSSAPAKINLSFEVTGRRDSAYHLVRTVMQAVSIREVVRLKKSRNHGINLVVSRPGIPLDKNNTAYKAALAFFEYTGLKMPGIDIEITKNIPVGAGLAGGSADAAAVLVGLNVLFGTGLDTGGLSKIGGKVGADVPFCITGGAALGTGTGTELEMLPSMPDCFIVIAKPEISVSTAEAYRLIDGAVAAVYSRSIEDAMRTGDLHSIARGMFNQFEDVLGIPEVDRIKGIMNKYRCLGCQMTGSGSAVFGIFDSEKVSQSCAAELDGLYSDVFICRPDPEGARIEKLQGMR